MDYPASSVFWYLGKKDMELMRTTWKQFGMDYLIGSKYPFATSTIQDPTAYTGYTDAPSIYDTNWTTFP